MSKLQSDVLRKAIETIIKEADALEKEKRRKFTEIGLKNNDPQKDVESLKKLNKNKNKKLVKKLAKSCPPGI